MTVLKSRTSNMYFLYDQGIKYSIELAYLLIFLRAKEYIRLSYNMGLGLCNYSIFEVFYEDS